MKKITMIFGALLLFLAITTVPVFAHEESTGNSTSFESEVAQQKQEAAAKAKIEAQKQKFEDRKAAIKTEVEASHATLKLDICKQRSSNIQTAINNMSQNSSRILERFNSVYTKVDNYKDSNSLSVNNYNDLIVKVDAAQTQAAADVQTAQSFKFTLNCDDSGVGQQIDSARQAAKTARESLKAYRSALKDLVAAVRQAAIAAEGGDNAQTN